jgi:hypothetical protein
MTDITELDDALSAALNSLAAAQGGPPQVPSGPQYRRASQGRPQPAADVDSYGPARRAIGIMADLDSRMSTLEAQRATEAAQDEVRKTRFAW